MARRRAAPARAKAGAPHERLKAFTDEVNAAVESRTSPRTAFAALDTHLDYPHAMLLLLDGTGGWRIVAPSFTS